jgi:hypothetical protein
MAISDYIPNVFGVENPTYTGLLGADQSASLRGSSNIAGLLGAASALAQGVSGQGGRRSAAQNIINALASGYGAAGQSYQQGLQNYGQTQQLAMQQRQQAGVQAMKMKYPDLADEFDTNPAGAFRIVSEREAAAKKPIVVEGNLVDPTGKVLFTANKPEKPQARMLTNQEAADAGLPYREGQRYQVDATGKLDLVQGTALAKENKPATSIEEFQFYQSQGGTKSYENFMKDKTPSTTVNVMPQGSVPLGKEGANKVDTQLLDLGQSRLNLQSIASNFNPKYLETPFKLKMTAVAEGEKIGIKPDAQTAAELADYSRFTQDSYTQLNNYINQITGAAVGSGDEEKRLRKGIPDPQKDSPTEYVAKLNAKIREGRLYEARLGYIKQNGMKMTDVDVNKIPTLMREREAKIKSNKSLFGNKDYNPKDVNHNAIVKSILSREFGLME